MGTALKINNLSVLYGETEALKNISLEVKEGDYLGIIGPNGGGKSTLLKAILGLVPRASGEITLFDGKKREVGYVPQSASFDRNFPITLFETVLTGRLSKRLRPFFRYSQEDKDIASGLIDRLGLQKLSGRRISDLSGGEFQKTLIARALAQNPGLLLLDEPTTGVDTSSEQHIYEILAELNKELTIILVTHDLLAISSEVKNLACLNKTLIYHGKPELNDNIVQSLYGCPVELIAHGVPHRVLKEHGGHDCC